MVGGLTTLLVSSHDPLVSLDHPSVSLCKWYKLFEGMDTSNLCSYPSYSTIIYKTNLT